MPFSLIELLRKRKHTQHCSPLDYQRSTNPNVSTGYLDTIQSVKPANGRWKILVLDKHSQSLVYGVLKTFEILELGVQRKLLSTSNSFNINGV
jgi:hypothetical protein